MIKKHKIINGLVFLESGAFQPESVYLCDDRIVSEETYTFTEGEEALTDAEGN